MSNKEKAAACKLPRGYSHILYAGSVSTVAFGYIGLSLFMDFPVCML